MLDQPGRTMAAALQTCFSRPYESAQPGQACTRFLSLRETGAMVAALPTLTANRDESVMLFGRPRLAV